jgi:hypothetical protein
MGHVAFKLVLLPLDCFCTINGLEGGSVIAQTDKEEED